MDLGVEHGDPEAFGRGDVGVGVRDALDQAVETEAAQIVGHLVGGVVRAEQAGDEAPEALVGEAGDGVGHDAERADQGHGAWIPEAQCSGSLALPCVGL
ncbi:MAG: hypothetical protein ACP5VR_12230 [Acidimicrobiales bacterium]